MSELLPRLRGALLALVIGINVLDAIPLQTPPSRRNLAEPAVHDELVRISEGLGALGVEVTAEEVEDAVFHGTRRGNTWRRAVLGPLKPFRRFTGTGQAWGFFGYPETYPYWLVVEGRVDEGSWEPLYVPRSREHTVLKGKLRFRRLQFMFVDVERGTRQDAVMSRLADRVAPEVFALRPELSSVRVYLHREKTPRPGRQASKPPEKKWVQVRHREDET